MNTTKIYKARRGARSTGFNMTAVSSFLSFGLLAMLLIGLINNTPKTGQSAAPFNWTASLIIIAVAFLAWLGMVVALAQFMKNTPRTVWVERDRLLIEGAQGPEAEIPFAEIEYIRKTEVPVSYWKYQASFRGLLIHYKNSATGQEQDYILSDRDTTSFDELIEQLRTIIPRSSPRREVAKETNQVETEKETTSDERLPEIKSGD